MLCFVGVALLQHSLQDVAPQALKLAVDLSLAKLRLLTSQGLWGKRAMQLARPEALVQRTELALMCLAVR